MTTVAQGPGLHEVARNVFAWIGPEGRTNAGFVTWDDGVLVVDSLYGSALVQGLWEQIRSVTDRPVRYVIDTHEHWDHCFGNQYFDAALFLGHENCRRTLIERPDAAREFGVQSMITRNQPAIAEEFRVVSILPPVITYAESMTVFAGTRPVELRYLGRAHTAGDTVVWLPNERIALTGDLFVNGRSPYAGDGYPRAWITALRRLEELSPATLVPGHGDLGAAADIATLRDWMAGAVATLDQARTRGMTQEQAQQELQLSVPEGWPNPQGGMDLIAPYYREARA
jgi:glyoxylase-like metal-dependent hydrolase (beta-lactamase superfamily II)